MTLVPVLAAERMIVVATAMTPRAAVEVAPRPVAIHVAAIRPRR